MIYLSWAIWFKRTSPLTDWTTLSCAGHKQEVCHFGNERDYRQVSWTLLSCQSQAWFSIIYCCLQFYVSSSNQAYKSFFTIPTPDNYCKNLKWFACGAAFAWVALLGNNSKLHCINLPEKIFSVRKCVFPWVLQKVYMPNVYEASVSLSIFLLV